MGSGASHHNLCFYGDDSVLVDHVAPFLSQGLDAHEAVVVVVDARKRALLTEQLGANAARMDWIDRDAYYTRPEEALAGYDARIRRYVRGGAPRIRVFGELPLCRTPEESDTWILYEAVLNVAFAHHPVTILCGLDARDQPDSVVSGSWETHPVSLNQKWTENSHFHDPSRVVRAKTPPPMDTPRLPALAAGADARTLRSRLRAELADAEVPEAACGNLLAAAGEVFANAYRHGGGVRSVRAGRFGQRFVCEIADHGAGLDDPLAGYVPPHPGRGAGLWVARQLTDRLEMISTERGLTTRLWV